MTNSKASSPTIDTVSIDIKLKPDPKGKKANEIRPKMKPILIKKRHEIGISSKEFQKQAVKRKKSKTLRLVGFESNSTFQKRSGTIFRHLHRQQNLELETNSYLNLALSYFAKYLKHFRSVRSLKVITIRNNGDDKSKEGFKLFGRKLRDLKKVKNLEIRISNNSTIGEEEILLLCQGFKYLKLMKSLRVHFGWCDAITDKAIPHLAQYFKHTTLQSFFLSVSRCDRIGCVGLEELCNRFKINRKLKDITFTFDNCYGLTDRWFHILQYNAKLIKNLRRINLKISKCPNIRFNQVDRLRSQLRSLSWKKKLQFRYKILTPGRKIRPWQVVLIGFTIFAVLLGILIGIPLGVSSGI